MDDGRKYQEGERASVVLKPTESRRDLLTGKPPDVDNDTVLIVEGGSVDGQMSDVG